MQHKHTFLYCLSFSCKTCFFLLYFLYPNYNSPTLHIRLPLLPGVALIFSRALLKSCNILQSHCLGIFVVCCIKIPFLLVFEIIFAMIMKGTRMTLISYNCIYSCLKSKFFQNFGWVTHLSPLLDTYLQIFIFPVLFSMLSTRITY